MAAQPNSRPRPGAFSKPSSVEIWQPMYGISITGMRVARTQIICGQLNSEIHPVPAARHAVRPTSRWW